MLRGISSCQGLRRNLYPKLSDGSRDGPTLSTPRPRPPSWRTAVMLDAERTTKYGGGVEGMDLPSRARKLRLQPGRCCNDISGAFGIRRQTRTQRCRRKQPSPNVVLGIMTYSTTASLPFLHIPSSPPRRPPAFPASPLPFCPLSIS